MGSSDQRDARVASQWCACCSCRAWALALALVAVPGVVGAQDADEERPPPKVYLEPLEIDHPRSRFGPRTMHHHAFVPPLMSDDAFVATYAEARLGMRVGGATEIVPTLARYRHLGFVGGDVSVGFGLRLWDFLGLRGHAALDLIAGTSENALLGVGAQAGLAWDWGVSVRVVRLRGSGTQITLLGRIAGHTGLDFDPQLLFEVADLETLLLAYTRITSGDTPMSLVFDRELVLGGVSLAVAQAIGRHGSVQFTADVKGGRLRSSLLDLEFVRPSLLAGFGIVGSIDGWPDPPVGFRVEYRLDRMAFGEPRDERPETDEAGRPSFEGKQWPVPDVDELIDRVELVEDATGVEGMLHRIGGGVFYTGHPDLVVGMVAWGPLNWPEDHLLRTLSITAVVQGYL